MEFEGNISPGFNALQLSKEVKSLLLRLGETPENFTGRIIFMSMLTTSHVDQKTMKKNANPMVDSFLYMRKDLTGIHTYIDLRVAQEKGACHQSTIFSW